MLTGSRSFEQYYYPFSHFLQGQVLSLVHVQALTYFTRQSDAPFTGHSGLFSSTMLCFHPHPQPLSLVGRGALAPSPPGERAGVRDFRYGYRRHFNLPPTSCENCGSASNLLPSLSPFRAPAAQSTPAAHHTLNKLLTFSSTSRKVIAWCASTLCGVWTKQIYSFPSRSKPVARTPETLSPQPRGQQVESWQPHCLRSPGGNGEETWEYVPKPYAVRCRDGIWCHPHACAANDKQIGPAAPMTTRSQCSWCHEGSPVLWHL